MTEPIEIDFGASSLFRVENSPEHIYRLLMAAVNVPAHLLGTPSATSGIALQIKRAQDKATKPQTMPMETTPGERVPTKAMNIYVKGRVDKPEHIGRHAFTWDQSLNIFRCDWTVNREITRCSEPYHRWYVKLDNKLVKLPFGKAELGGSPVCDLCPNQFACLAGNQTGYLIGDDLPDSVPSAYIGDLFK